METRPIDNGAGDPENQHGTTRRHVVFVLDETGSMQSIKRDTIAGFNSYVEELRAVDPQTLFTLIQFDSNQTKVVYQSEPLHNVALLNEDTYLPGAMTNLIDTVAEAILRADHVYARTTAIVVQTDGQENASRNFTAAQLSELVRARTARGWLFTFLGAGIDAWGQASQFGFQKSHTIAYGRERSQDVFRAASRSTRAYMSSGLTSDASFTVDERLATKEDEVTTTTGGSNPS